MRNEISFTIRKATKNSIVFWPMMVRPSFQGRRAFIAAFPNENWKMSIKKSSLHNGNWFRNFSLCLYQSLYDVKQKAQQELCVPLGIMNLIAKYCRRWHRIFKGLSQDGESAHISKSICASLFNKNLSNEPSFGRIHLVGQYLYNFS